MKKLDKQFVSDIDKKLAEFDATHPKSAAQQAEIAKYERIYALRDGTQKNNNEDDQLWA